MSRSRIVTLALVAALLIAALVFHRPLIGWFTGKGASESGKTVSVVAGPFSVRASLDPDPPRQNGNALVLEVTDAAGKAIDDATIAVIWDMPAMGAMAEMKGAATVTHASGGHYRATFDVPMGGTWTLRTAIESPRGKAAQDFTLTVGAAGLSALGASSGDIDHYTCSMHPTVHQATPGKCPICGMDLIAVTKDQMGTVKIDAARRQLIGVRTQAVVDAPLQRTVRAVGRIEYDETSLVDVSLKVRGWIVKLQADRTGQRVTRGQTLFTLYSPDLYAAQQDFLVARGSEALAKASRQRLRLLGMSDGQIDAVAKSGTASENIAFPSPATGFIIEKNVVEGGSVDAGARLFRIAGLDKVWVEAEIYEAELALVTVGQHVDVTLDYVPGVTHDGKVAYVYPYIDPKSRTGRARVELANAGLELRPGMYAHVTLHADLGNRIQVPASAIVYTGPRRLVFVDLGDGRFQPSEIEIGTESDGIVEVRSGVKAGDIVAISGVFLIAAEARISTAAKYWENGNEADAAPVPKPK